MGVLNILNIKDILDRKKDKINRLQKIGLSRSVASELCITFVVRKNEISIVNISDYLETLEVHVESQ